MSWVAVAVAGAAVVGGVASNNASKRAASAQQGAADAASNAQLAMFDETSSNLRPWASSGKVALSQLSQGLGLIGAPGTTGGTYKWNGGTYKDLGSLRGAIEQNYVKESGIAESKRTGQHHGGLDPYDPSVQASIDKWMERIVAEQPQQQQAQVGPNSNAPLLKPFGMEDFKESPAYQFNLQQGQKAIEKAAAKRGTFYAPATLQDISKFSQGMASNEFQNAYSNYNTNMKNIWDRLFAMSGTGQNAAAQTGAFGTTVGGQVGENMIGAGNAQAAGIVGGANALNGAIGQGYNAYTMNQILQNNQQSSVGGLRQNPNMTGAGDLNLYTA